MVVTILIWGVLFCTFYLYGSLFFLILNRTARLDGDGLDWIGKVLAGMAVCTALGLWFNLVLPLKQWPPLIIIAGALISAPILCKYGTLHFPKIVFSKAHSNDRSVISKISDCLVIILGVVAFAFILINTQVLPANPDTSLYHAQAIHWIENFRVVPGLVHLHSRLAYNSSWLVLNALFSFSFLNGISYHVLPGFLFCITIFGLLQSVRSMLPGRGKLSGLFSLFIIPLLFLVSASEISSPGTDLPVILTSIMIANYSIRWFETESKPRFYLLLLLVLSIFSVTLKLSGVPLLLFVLILFCLVKGDRIWLLKNCAALAAFLWIPWMTRSVVMSGYLVYPVPFPDIFNFEWKATLTRLYAEQQGLRAWAINSHMDKLDVLALPFTGQLKIWIQEFSINRRLLIAFAFLTPIVTGTVSLLSSRIRHQLKDIGFWYFLLPFYVGLWYWLLSAPDIRFGYAYILPIHGLSLAMFYMAGEIILSRPEITRKILVVIEAVLFLFIFQMFVRSVDTENIKSHLLTPTDYPKSPTKICQMGDFSVFCAQSYSQCWYEPFPCVPKPDEKIFMRGETLQEGFFSIRQ